MAPSAESLTAALICIAISRARAAPQRYRPRGLCRSSVLICESPRHYDIAQTPYHRLLESGALSIKMNN
jgi:hypothetical protein